MGAPLLVIGIPFHPNGLVRARWATYTLNTLASQGIPGCQTEHVWRDNGESIPEAYNALLAQALEKGATYIGFLEHDLYVPPGGWGHLVECLSRPEHADYGAIGAVYFWRAGYNVDWPLIGPTRDGGPKLDWTPGDFVPDVAWCGQGVIVVRAAALKSWAGPWWASDWRTADAPDRVYRGAADLFFFEQLRARGWKIGVDTRVCCEHQDIMSGEVYPQDLATRRRYGKTEARPFGFEPENALWRLSQRERRRRLNPRNGQNLIGHITPGPVDAAVAPPPFTGQRATDPLPAEPAAPPRVALGLNVGWGGCGIRPDLEGRLIGQPHGTRGWAWENLDFTAAKASLPADVVARTHHWADDHRLVLPDNRYDAVYAHHVLEHIPGAHTVAALKEWWRVCRDGGRVILGVPNAKLVAEYIVEDKFDAELYPLSDGSHVTPAHIIWGAQRYPGDTHVTGFSLRRLRNALAAAGIPGESFDVVEDQNGFALLAVCWKGRALNPTPSVAPVAPVGAVGEATRAQPAAAPGPAAVPGPERNLELLECKIGNLALTTPPPAPAGFTWDHGTLRPTGANGEPTPTMLHSVKMGPGVAPLRVLRGDGTVLLEVPPGATLAVDPPQPVQPHPIPSAAPAAAAPVPATP